MSEVDDLLESIKMTWPNFDITKQGLLHPTQELVFRFFTQFMSEYKDKVTYLANTESAFDVFSDIELPEERLFQQLSLTAALFPFKLAFADIVTPSKVRTKNLFKLCVHFIRYLDTLLPEAEALGGKVFEARDDFTQLLMKQEQILDEINNNAKKKAELIDEVTALMNEHKSTLIAYEDMEEAKVLKEKIYAEKNNEIDNINRAIATEHYELNSLETVHHNLLEEKITNNEYENIVQALKILKSESEKLDSFDINLEDGLEKENKVLQHSAECLRVLSKYELNVNISAIIEQEENLKAILHVLENLIQARLHPLRQKKLVKQQELLTANGQLLNLHNELKAACAEYSKNLEQIMQEIDRISRENDGVLQKNKNTIANYQKAINKNEEDLKKMRKHFQNEYIKISEIEKNVVDKFKNVILSLKNLT